MGGKEKEGRGEGERKEEKTGEERSLERFRVTWRLGRAVDYNREEERGSHAL